MKLHQLCKALLASTALSLSMGAFAAAPVTALDNPNTVVTVMQFTLKDPAKKAVLQERLVAMKNYLRKQPSYIDNALMANRNGDAAPQFVGVSRWKSFKDWEALWQKPEMQKLVSSIGEVADVSPGTFAPVK